MIIYGNTGFKNSTDVTYYIFPSPSPISFSLLFHLFSSLSIVLFCFLLAGLTLIEDQKIKSFSFSFRKYTGLTLFQSRLHIWTNHFGKMKVIDELAIHRVCTSSWKCRMSSTQLSWPGTGELEVSHGISESYNEIKILGRQANSIGLLQGSESLECSGKAFSTPIKATAKAQ